eukprot:TRINITY_DN75342_c0_g1_i1.p1 TRINITY_DN75342_c0_g1~~TRINITY_DN75342_c0_g1_i1.p1  ORF type:complete len:253 (+),score=35.98 TRINITY_DN75342_c0_g1_i1:404-1162(+)
MCRTIIATPSGAIMSARGGQLPPLSFNDGYGAALVANSVAGAPEEESEEFLAAIEEPIPLSGAWTLWEQLSTEKYHTNKVVTFGTVQEFWSIWNGIPQPSELLDGKKFIRVETSGHSTEIGALMIFRDGIAPEWEHPANSQGGHFQLTLKAVAIGGQVDEYWNNIVLAIIGGTLEPCTKVNGVRLVDKLGTRNRATDHIRIELWYSSKITKPEVDILKKSMEKCMTTRLDGTLGPSLKHDAIHDKKHASMGR